MRPSALLLWLVLTALATSPAQLPQPPGARLPSSNGSAGAVPAEAEGTCLVIPFENQTGTSSLDWIGEGLVDAVSDGLRGSSVTVLDREQRAAIFDQAGIPALPTLTRATVLSIASNVDARFVVSGSYTLEHQQFQAQAEIIDLRSARLTRIGEQRGPLQQLMTVENRLAWAIRRQVDPAFDQPLDDYLAARPNVSLAAYEHYIRGLVAADPQQQLTYLREAVQLQANYSRAIQQLGLWYFDNGEDAAALRWLERVERGSPRYLEARFTAGLAAFRLGDFNGAATLFREVAAELPLPEVLNNLGLAEARLGAATAETTLKRALDADPRDSEVRLNLAATLYRKGDRARALATLREGGELSPEQPVEDFLDALESDSQPVNTALVRKVEALKLAFPAEAFRELQAAIVDFNAARASQLPGAEKVNFHLAAGNDLLAKGAFEGAEQEYRAALALDGNSAAAHAGLARLLALRGRWPEAHQEAAAALALDPANPDAIRVRDGAAGRQK